MDVGHSRWASFCLFLAYIFLYSAAAYNFIEVYKLPHNGGGYMTFAGGFAEANVAKPEAIA